MVIDRITLQIEDLLWFAVDKVGHVMAFTSGGFGNVPSFVCKSKEETEFLETYFLNDLSESASVEDNLNEEVGEDASILLRKGIFCFDTAVNQSNRAQYILMAAPEKPILFDDLPDEVKHVLKDHCVDCDASLVTEIEVKHAY